MIFVLHGDDFETSYQRLSQLLKTYPKHQPIRFNTTATFDQIYLAIYSEDLTKLPKIIICENFLKLKKIANNNFFSKIPKDQIVIFWETTKIEKRLIEKLKNLAKIEVFTKNQLFLFLDSFTPNSKITLSNFIELTSDQKVNLLWHLANRLFLLILAKIGAEIWQIQSIVDKPLFDWQWQKISKQAKLFDLATLSALYQATLRCDFAIKTAKTALAPETLIPLLFLKYLKG